MQYYIGIDPGLDGGITVVSSEGSIAMKTVTPTLGTKGKGKRAYDIPSMVSLLEPYQNNGCVYIESVHAMPGQGVSSMFSMGYGLGAWHGVISALKIPMVSVTPQKWQKIMFQGLPKDDTKRCSAVIASRLQPNTDWRATERSKNPHSGLTDSFCIAEYGRITLLG